MSEYWRTLKEEMRVVGESLKIIIVTMVVGLFWLILVIGLAFAAIGLYFNDHEGLAAVSAVLAIGSYLRAMGANK